MGNIDSFSRLMAIFGSLVLVGALRGIEWGENLKREILENAHVTKFGAELIDARICCKHFCTKKSCIKQTVHPP